METSTQRKLFGAIDILAGSSIEDEGRDDRVILPGDESKGVEENMEAKDPQ
jgi:hypothetical protein